MAKGYSELANELVSAANGVDYAYRDTRGGDGAAPLVLLQHFRGNLDNWDPALIGALADAARLGRELGDPRHAAWQQEALATAQRCGMRALASQLLPGADLA